MKITRKNVNIAGGDLPTGYSTKIDIEFDYTGISESELINRLTSGQSDRVRTQTMLRKMSTARLNQLAKDGFKIHWKTIGSPMVADPVDTIMSMSLANFMKTLVEDLGSTVENAIEIYAKKHGVTVEFVTEEWNKLNPTEEESEE